MATFLVLSFLIQNHLFNHLQLPVLSPAKPYPQNVNLDRSQSSACSIRLPTRWLRGRRQLRVLLEHLEFVFGRTSSNRYFFFLFGQFDLFSLLFDTLLDAHPWIDLFLYLFSLSLLLFLCWLFSIFCIFNWFFFNSIRSSYSLVSLLRMVILNECPSYPL